MSLTTQDHKKTVCIISPFPPPYGGMAIQAQKLVSFLEEIGMRVLTVKTNADLPNSLLFISKVKGFRTIVRMFCFLRNLRKTLPQVEIVYFLTGFFNFFFWVTYPALILIKLHGKKVILSARGGEARHFFEKYRPLVKPILRRVDTISTPSGFLKQAFEEVLGLDAVIVPNIADFNQFRFRPRRPVRPNLLVTRSLEEIYNVGCVIRAFKKVHDYIPESSLGIVGDGSQRAALEKLVGDLRLNGCVTFYGKIEHSEIQSYYNQYDILINASNADNLPGVILEAFASGLPVISTRAGGIPYLVEEGVTGLLVDIGDCEALAEKVIKLVRDPELALTLANNARIECRKYSWENVRTALIPLLERHMSDAKN
jgi:glycosyltransferase involved in cell wall biosynthesis